MNTLARTAFAAALLLAPAPAFTEDAHHPATTGAPAAGTSPEAGSPAAPAAPASPMPGAGPGMMGGGMMDGHMMQMMGEMMARHAGMMGGIMPAEGMGGGVAMRQIMSPERIEGRIAFLRAELKVTEAQEPLWQAVAEALRAHANANKGMMKGRMMRSDDSAPLPQRLTEMERTMSARLDGLRRLKMAMEPFYASLDEAQKAAADDLLMPMGML